jgi:hypothetical protein
MAGLGLVGGHAAAHIAESDEGDLVRHGDGFPVRFCGRGNASGSASPAGPGPFCQPGLRKRIMNWLV